MLAEMENGLVALLKASALKQFMTVIDTLPDLDGDTFVKKLAAEAPGIYVAIGKIDPRDGVLRAGFGLACTARNARGHAAARQGDTKTVGVYQMMESVMAVVHGVTAGGATWLVAGVEMLSDEKLYANGLTVGVVSVETTVTMPLGIDAAMLAALADFKVFHADYDIDPFETAAEHSKWLEEPPDQTDSKPEADDQLQVQP